MRCAAASIRCKRAGARSTSSSLSTPVPALVEADPTRLAQIIDNILDNAVKYSPDGGRIEVAVRHAGGFAELVVRDAGMGIAPELLPKVFTIFVQGKQSLQRVQGGLGIGLSLVRRLAEMHGGTVAIDSAGVGQGATVTVRLPLMADQAAAAPAASAAPGPARRRVLLIEDNADAREMMAALLEMLSCEVTAAATGPQGIAMALQCQPEIAFIDIGLAGMDGYAIAQRLAGRSGDRADRTDRPHRLRQRGGSPARFRCRISTSLHQADIDRTA